MKTKLLSGAFLLCLVLTVRGDDWLEKYLDDPASVPGEVLALVQVEDPDVRPESETAAPTYKILTLRMVDASSDTMPERFQVQYSQPQSPGEAERTSPSLVPVKDQLYLGVFRLHGEKWTISGPGAIKHVANFDRTTLNRAQKRFKRPYNTGPIGELVRNLSGGLGLWITNGASLAVSLPPEASLETVAAKFLELTDFEGRRVKGFSIIEKARVMIPPLPVEYDAVVIRSDLGLKVMLMRYELPEKLWWAKFFSVEVIKHTPGEQKGLLIKKWGHEVEERPTWPRCV